MEAVKQCRSCPWRVRTDPLVDIPNGYSVELHEKLRSTISDGTCAIRSQVHMMACHYSPVGKETPCAGWLHHQLGVGNNIAVRLKVMLGSLPPPEVDGEQHETFEATLPKRATKRTKQATKKRR